MKRIYQVETVVKERRIRTIEAPDEDTAQDIACGSDYDGQMDADPAIVSSKTSVTDVQVHDIRDVTTDYRDLEGCE